MPTLNGRSGTSSSTSSSSYTSSFAGCKLNLLEKQVLGDLGDVLSADLFFPAGEDGREAERLQLRRGQTLQWCSPMEEVETV